MITDFMNEINAISNDANSVNSRSDNDVRTPKQVQSSSEIASITGVASSCRYGSEWCALVVIGTIGFAWSLGSTSMVTRGCGESNRGSGIIPSCLFPGNAVASLTSHLLVQGRW